MTRKKQSNEEKDETLSEGKILMKVKQWLRKMDCQNKWK
jgi:hypothetical protein